MTRILTHRGLDPSRAPYFAESSFEAFVDQLNRGFGLEVDIAPAMDGLVLSHDQDLLRATQGSRSESIADLTLGELQGIDLRNGHIASLPALLTAAQATSEPLLAVHVKARAQDPAVLDRIAAALKDVSPHSFFLFDLLPESAAYLKRVAPTLPLGASVAHTYDIARYGALVGGTLLSLERAQSLRELYDWIVLDEWDRIDADGTKTLHTPETYATARAAGFKIMTIAPELHASSPALYGGEAHEDAATPELLVMRTEELLAFRPDAYCTDYPDAAAARIIET